MADRPKLRLSENEYVSEERDLEESIRPTRENLDKAAQATVDFLKDHQARAALKDFLIHTYKKFEAEKVNQFKARVENEHQVNSQTSKDFHTPGNIAPLMAEDFNMNETERAFTRSLALTKKNLLRSVEDRVDEINRLLAGIGGFSSQLKSCFARNTVVFLEEEDPKHSYRERIVFSINLPNYELHRPMNADGSTAGPSRHGALKGDDGGRTAVQATWDDAVNALAKIVESSGLKPRYCKNDRKHGRFIMKQDLRSRGVYPDEYFSFTLDYNTDERIKELANSYNKLNQNYETRIQKLTRSVSRYPASSTSFRFLRLKKELSAAVHERDYFVGNIPDPNQIEPGILFVIEVFTSKDYHIVKDRMQSLMTKFILHLSRIASKEAEFDPDLEYELWKNNQKGKGNGTERQEPHFEGLESVQEYEIEESALRPVPKKKAA